MTVVLLCVLLGVVGYAGWKLTARGAYEAAEYRVVEVDGAIEIRDYPDLMVASTGMAFRSQGDDGSFMRLFRFIQGANEDQQKVAMTIPVFMDRDHDQTDGRMAFVMPKSVVEQGVPQPTGDGVRIRRRNGGRFAVIRFAGRIDDRSVAEAESRLQDWLQSRNIGAASEAEVAGYDPPWTPGPLRRNEVLIRLADAS